MFKVGDKVRRITESICPEEFGYKGQIYTVLQVLSSKDIQVVDGCGGAESESFELVEDAPEYEKNWTFVDKAFIQSGEKIPEDAKLLKDDSGDVVAFKKVKKPVEEYLTRYLRAEFDLKGKNVGWSTGTNPQINTHKIVLKLVDGEPVSAEISKL